VSGVRRTLTSTLGDAAIGLLQRLAGTGRGLDRLAAAAPPRRVLVLSIYRPGSMLPQAISRLHSDRHTVELALGAIGEPDPALAADTLVEGLEGGKFENLNRLLRAVPPVADFDWTLVVDDDIALPARFLDRFVALCDRLALDLAQPAQTLRSHAAWRVTRRRPASVARETRFVEIGPLAAFGRVTAAELLPFPDLRFGWGLDLHWASLARERGWRCGVIDALPVHHARAPVAGAYDQAEAVDEGRRFLATRSYLPSTGVDETLVTHRRPPRSS
jgi:hypothetical protein